MKWGLLGRAWSEHISKETVWHIIKASGWNPQTREGRWETASPHPISRWHTGRLSYHEAQTMTTAKSSSFSEWLSKAHSLPGPQISFWEKWSWAAFMTSWLAENSSLLLRTPSCWLKCHFHGGFCPDQIDNIRSPCHRLSGLLKSLPVPSLMRQCG